MSGAMAGSTTTTHQTVSDRLEVVTLTINNRCNLRCPHCYLQYDGPSGRMADSVIDAVLRSGAQHVAIVGKEPLVDRESVLLSEALVRQSVLVGKTVSLVTNGLRLDRLSSEALKALAWVDVSLDGGPSTYRRYRRGNFARLIGSVNNAVSAGLRSANALHTLSSVNLNAIDDMMAVAQLAPWEKIIFSPYMAVKNHGQNPTSPVALVRLLAALGSSAGFMSNPRAFLLLGSDAFLDEKLSPAEVAHALADAGLTSKVFRVEHDPLQLGYLRVTYDGFVMTPYQSLHPADYRTFATTLDHYSSIDSAFAFLRAA